MARFNPRNLRSANVSRNAGKQLASSVSSSGSKFVARLLAVRTSWMLVLALTPVWFLILAVWILSVLGIAAASFSVFGWQLISDDAAIIFILLGWVLHLLTFIIAFIAYWISGVECTGMWALNILIILVAASVIPGLQLVPWVFLYMLAIVLLQTGKKSAW